MWKQSCATFHLEVFRQWIQDQTVSGCASEPGCTCLSFNRLYLLRGARPKTSSTSLPKVTERPAAAVGPGEPDHLLVVGDRDDGVKVEHAKRPDNNVNPDKRSTREELSAGRK